MWVVVETRPRDGHVFCVKPYQYREDAFRVAQAFFDTEALDELQKLELRLKEFGEVCHNGTVISILETS